MVGIITREEKKRKAKERYKDEQSTRKQKRKLIPFVVGSYLTHDPSSVTCIQIVKSNTVVCTFITC